MSSASAEQRVQPEEFRVSGTAQILSARLANSLSICIHDDTQGAGGILHLRYALMDGTRPIELTDTILSSNLLLLDRFCKELRGLGARKTSWRVRIVGHIPPNSGFGAPAASVVDLLKAYFQDTRLPVETKEIARSGDILMRFDSRTGKIVVSDAD
jgi:chemotaxis receptor (MCP) glutamine deamidase CheD